MVRKKSKSTSYFSAKFGKTLLKRALSLGLVAAGLTYLFLQVDVIPDSITILGYVDDAVVLVLALFVYLFFKNKYFRGKK